MLTTLRHGLLPRWALLVVFALSYSSPLLGAVNVLERAYNKNRTGANPAEAVLTPANVNSTANQFHKRFVLSVDGKIEGSPLYASASRLPAARTM